MTCVCIRDCQFKGVVIHKGEERELTEQELASRPANFKVATPPEAEAPDAERPEGSPELLTRAQLKAHLDSMGIPYRVRDSYAELKEIYDRAVSADPKTRIGA